MTAFRCPFFRKKTKSLSTSAILELAEIHSPITILGIALQFTQA
jgi:hypothetical protein